jgi:hypothetical protein
MPIQSRFTNSNEEEDDDDDENRWYHLRSSSPPIHSATMGSWGFDVNRSTNGQTPLNNNNSSDHQTITTATKDYNERFVDISSPPQNSKLRRPTLTKHRNGQEFAAVDRLVLGPNQMSSQPKTQTEHELFNWQNRMIERFVFIL